MKISQLIKELELIKAEHGDIPVTVKEGGYDISGGWGTPSSVDVDEGWCRDYDDPEARFAKRKHVRLYE